MKFTILGHHYNTRQCTQYVWSILGSKENDFYRNTSILYFLPQNEAPFEADNARRTIAIGHPSDSDELKMSDITQKCKLNIYFFSAYILDQVFTTWYIKTPVLDV